MKPVLPRTLATALAASLSFVAHAQLCGLSNNVRLAHGMCNTAGDSETRVDTGLIAAGPLVSSTGAIRDNGCGCHSELTATMSSEYGSLSYQVSAQGNSCNCCGIFLWADEGGSGGRARFKDRLSIQSASLPAFSPATVRATLTFLGSAYASNANSERSFSGELYFNGDNAGMVVANQQGTTTRDYNVYVGQSNIDIFAQINCVLRDYTLLGTNASGSLGADLSLTLRIEPVTPGITISACSGHDYGAPVCDSIDFNRDGLFPDTQDIDDFLSVFSGGVCSTGTCGDTDFNNDGLFPDTADIDALLSVFSGGPCL